MCHKSAERHLCAGIGLQVRARGVGRPRAREIMKHLAVGMAQENPNWGHTLIRFLVFFVID